MERSTLKNKGWGIIRDEQKRRQGRREGSINRVTRYDIFIINHNASTHDPSGVFEEYWTRKEERESERERAAEAFLLFSNS